jgi:hypothetical protein
VTLEGKVQGGALPDGALGPDPAAMPLNDALHRRQADAGAWVFRAPMKALKGSEQRVSMHHVEAHAIVAHEEYQRTLVLRRASKLDARPGLFGGKLLRIAEQILQHNAQPPRIPVGDEAIRDGKFRLPRRLTPLQIGGNRPGQCTQIHRLPYALSSGHV